MARSKDVLLRFLVDDKQKSKLAGIGNEAQKTQSKFSQLSGGAKALVGGFAAVVGTKIIGFLGDAAAAAAEDQKAQELLKLALQNSTGATDDQVAATEDWITKTSLATGIADDELRPALANLARSTGDVEKAQDLLGDAMDIATAKGIPLETITKAIAKANDGNVGALGRLGIKIKDVDGKTLSFEEAMAGAAETMGGATATAADTAAGKMAILQVRMDEAKESLGNVLIPILAEGAEALNDMGVVADFLGEKLGEIPGPAGDVATKVTDMIGPFKLLNWAAGLAAGKVEEITAATQEAENPFQGYIDNLEDTEGAADDATGALEDLASEMRAQMDPMFNLIDKTGDLETAQTNSAIARDKYGEGSPEHLEALRNEAGAFLTLKDAQVKAAQESGITREKFGENLRAMGIFTTTEIDLMMAQFDRLDGRTIDTTINVNLKGRGASTFSDSRDPDDLRRAAGGPVMAGGTYLVGERGPELLSMGTSNGHITPNDQLGGGSTYALTVNAGMGANGSEIGKLIVEHIRQYEKRNGRGWRS